MTERLVAVLDIGKTAAKLSLWTPEGRMLHRAARVNERVRGPRYPTLDVEGIERWLEAELGALSEIGDVGAVIPVAHGAAAALVRGGDLAAPVMDYEFEPSADLRSAYARERDSFAMTGSPAMGMALNLGLQLHCIERAYPDAFRGGAQIVPWAQFWAWKLCGVAACEVTSLGAHTDLWAPGENGPSALARRRGWAQLFAPLRHAADELAPITPHWAARTGLPADTAVHVGLHDSNAALVGARANPEFARSEAVLVSTGTWFVSMRSLRTESDAAALPEGAGLRGCLVNVDVDGRPAPTALFMGGRELELLGGVPIDAQEYQIALLEAAAECARAGVMVLPTMAAGTGPYPAARGEWQGLAEDPISIGATAALYAALMTETGLALVGAKGAMLIDGRFASANVFTRALASLRPDMEVYVSGAESDVAFGALRLVSRHARLPHALTKVAPLPFDLEPYARAWRAGVASR